MKHSIVFGMSLCLVSVTSQAAIATFEFGGTIKDVFDGFDVMNGGVNPYTDFPVGSEWSATLLVDLDSPPTPNSGIGSHEGAIIDGNLSIPDAGAEFPLFFQESINLLEDAGVVSFSYTTFLASDSVSFNFFDLNIPFPDNLYDLATTFDFSNINNAAGSISTAGRSLGSVSLDITSSSVNISNVPLPAGAWLFLSALGGLVGLRMKR